MALVLIEEVLMGLEEAKETLEQAVVTLANLTEDLTSDLDPALKGLLENNFLWPLQNRAAMLDTLMEELATR